MGAIATRHEVKAVAVHRIECRMDGFATDHRNRRRRQSRIHVSVIRRRFPEVSPGQLAAVAVAEAVDHRRVGLQQHAHRHAPHKHAGNLPALLRYAGFLFHQRSHDQRLVGFGVRCICSALFPLLGEHFIEAVVSGFQHLDIGHAPHVTIGVREEAPFRKNPGVAELVHDLAIAQTVEAMFELLFPGQRCADLTETPAFDQGQAVLNHFPAFPQVDQAFDGHAGLNAVFTAVQGLSGEVEAPIHPQPECVLDDATGFESV
ncbi:hypothetical protein D3C72_1529510 [compost metagenome]